MHGIVSLLWLCINVGKPNDDITTLYDGEQQCDEGCDRLLKHVCYTDLATLCCETVTAKMATPLSRRLIAK